jgi:hypothetical protein
VNVVRLAGIRAVIGAAFALLGAGIAIQLLLRPEPFNQKLMGLAFAFVLIALGALRVRGYLKLRRAAP